MSVHPRNGIIETLAHISPWMDGNLQRLLLERGLRVVSTDLARMRSSMLALPTQILSPFVKVLWNMSLHGNLPGACMASEILKQLKWMVCQILQLTHSNSFHCLEDAQGYTSVSLDG